MVITGHMWAWFIITFFGAVILGAAIIADLNRDVRRAQDPPPAVDPRQAFLSSGTASRDGKAPSQPGTGCLPPPGR